MSLSLQTARKVVEIVDSDADCRRVISDPFKSFLLEKAGLAGSARNAALLAFGWAFGKGEGTDEFNDLICQGIAQYTFKALFKNISKIPELRAVATSHRKHLGTHHEATWLRMTDDSEYIFDWHATLNIYNPLISRADKWQKAEDQIPLIHFGGFN